MIPAPTRWTYRIRDQDRQHQAAFLRAAKKNAKARGFFDEATRLGQK
jgi:hypothetical protein